MFAVSVKGGGLGFNPRSIGLILGLQGITTGFVQVCLFAPLHRRFGSKKILVTGYLCYLLLIISLPIMHALAAKETRWALWVVIGLHIAISCPAFMTFSEFLVQDHSSGVDLTY
jgi:steroid 5-alpha reductase family enzyme